VDDPLVEIEIEGVEGEDAQKVALEKPRPKTEEQVEEVGFGVVGTLEVAGDVAHAHPTSSEVYMEAGFAAIDKAIHI